MSVWFVCKGCSIVIEIVSAVIIFNGSFGRVSKFDRCSSCRCRSRSRCGICGRMINSLLRTVGIFHYSCRSCRGRGIIVFRCSSIGFVLFLATFLRPFITISRGWCIRAVGVEVVSRRHGSVGVDDGLLCMFNIVSTISRNADLSIGAASIAK